MFLIVTIMGIIQYLKGNKYAGLIVFLFLLTDGFQFVPPSVMLFGLNLYGKDYALMFSLTILISYLITGRIKFPYKSLVFLSLLIFFVYLVIAAFVDLRYFNPSVTGFVLMFRVNFFLLTYFWLNNIDNRLFGRIFKFVFVITVIQSILCLFQIPTGLPLLTGGGITEFNDLGFHWIRYTNLPYFLLPCMFILLMDKNIKIPYKRGIIILFFIVVLFTLSRTFMLAIITTMGVSVIVGLFKTQKKIVFGFIAIFILLLPIIGARLMSSTKDVSTAVTEDSIENGSEMTFAYRIFHATERFAYISKDLKHEIFGIGFIHERDFPKDTFLLGHRNNDYEITQLEQDDISWSNLFLRYGIFGTILYVLIFLCFLIYFFKNKKHPNSAAAFMFMFMSFILGFASGKFSQADFYLLPMFFFFYNREQILKNKMLQKESMYLQQIQNQ